MSAISLTDSWTVFGIMLALFLGGVVKGATGAGFPVIAVPVIASFSDVKTAVIILVIPNFIVNVLQIYKFRHADIDRRLLLSFAGMGVIGAILGTWFLSFMSAYVLLWSIAIIIFCYIFLRLINPSFAIPAPRVRPLSYVAGFGGGILQGSIGISSPIAVTFANAIRIERPAFILLISVFFGAMCFIQFPTQLLLNMVSIGSVFLGVMSILPMLVGVQLGDAIGKRMNTKTFDRVILILLALLAIKQLIWM